MFAASDFIVEEHGTLKDAIEKLNSVSGKQLIVLSAKNKVLAMVGNGDVRRAMLQGSLLSSPVLDHANTNFVSIRSGETDDLKALFTKYLISTIPVIDKDGHLLKIATILPPHYEIRLISFGAKSAKEVKR